MAGNIKSVWHVKIMWIICWGCSILQSSQLMLNNVEAMGHCGFWFMILFNGIYEMEAINIWKLLQI